MVVVEDGSKKKFPNPCAPLGQNQLVLVPIQVCKGDTQRRKNHYASRVFPENIPEN